ncbi:MAG: acyl-phosphate glycerol 3-phosphate acyltransferase [Legionellales bacterium]|nr:acyl-phosphate glycerol 3-phosphate acyltransferase [Legionellales bacterium]
MQVDFLLIIIAYLLGSLSAAVLVCNILGLSDPRSGGSRNPGTTNVMRLHGKKAAFLTLTGDILKGIIPVLLAKVISNSEIIIALSGLAAFLGHIFPIYFGFKGGKGVATLIGVLFATHWQLGVAYVLTWILTAFIFRYSSLAALIAAILTPLYAYFSGQESQYIVILIIIMIILLWKHKPNIINLIKKKEDKIG